MNTLIKWGLTVVFFCVELAEEAIEFAEAVVGNDPYVQEFPRIPESKRGPRD